MGDQMIESQPNRIIVSMCVSTGSEILRDVKKKQREFMELLNLKEIRLPYCCFYILANIMFPNSQFIVDGLHIIE